MALYESTPSTGGGYEILDIYNQTGFNGSEYYSTVQVWIKNKNFKKVSINSTPTHTATYRNFYVIQYDSSGNQLSSTRVNSGGTVTLASNCDKIMLDTYLVKTSLTGMECHFKDIIIE